MGESMKNNENGSPPKSGWSKLVPELMVKDLEISRGFWCDMLGFTVCYQRPEQFFCYLERPEGGQIMLSQFSRQWNVEQEDVPFGLGTMFQVTVDDLMHIHDRLKAADWPLDRELSEVWRRLGDREGGRLEIMVRDPNGYYVMIAQDLGQRALSAQD